jgi:hypothetical protein
LMERSGSSCSQEAWVSAQHLLLSTDLLGPYMRLS